MTLTPIYEFRGPHYFLSNFFPCKFIWQGIEWPSSENAYQAVKFPRSEWHKFATCTPTQSKKLGQQSGIREDWEEGKIAFMHDIVWEKFCQNLDLMEQLLATRGRELQEGNWWGDRFWGISPKIHGKGRNELGKLLMSIRAEFLEDEPKPQVHSIIYL